MYYGKNFRNHAIEATETARFGCWSTNRYERNVGAIGKNFVKIDSLFKEQGEVTTDIPYIEYPNFESLTEHNIKMIIGLKSSKELQGEGDIRSITIPERKIVSCLHRGTYSELAVLYNEMMEWIKTNGYKLSGTSIEYYYSNPNVPEEEQVTRIEMPLL